MSIIYYNYSKCSYDIKVELPEFDLETIEPVEHSIDNDKIHTSAHEEDIIEPVGYDNTEIIYKSSYTVNLE